MRLVMEGSGNKIKLNIFRLFYQVCLSMVIDWVIVFLKGIFSMNSVHSDSIRQGSPFLITIFDSIFPRITVG
jgi:hypothetical protein